MAYCGPGRIPHSWFLGGPYRWTAADREKALAWQRRESRRCSSCGTRHDEWDPDEGGDEAAYKAVAIRCPGCESRQRVEKALTDADGLGVQVQLWPQGGQRADPTDRARG